MNRILITGASGHIGKRVVELLADRAPLRLMSRSPEKLSAFTNAEKVQGDYSDATSLEAAFKDIEVAFIVSGYAPPGERALLHKNAIDAAQRAQVKHLVYLSFQGASEQSKFPMGRDHHQTEQFIRHSGIAHTLLRDNLYMDMIPEMFNERGVMKGPGGNGGVAWVAREDVSRCIAQVLLEPSTFEGPYNITGPESLTLADTAERFSKLKGQTYTYQDETVEEGRKWREALGASDWEVDTWLGSYEAIAAGEMADVSDSVYQITGKQPVRLEPYLSQIIE